MPDAVVPEAAERLWSPSEQLFPSGATLWRLGREFHVSLAWNSESRPRQAANPPKRDAPRDLALHQRSDVVRFLVEATQRCALVPAIVRHGLTTFDLRRSNFPGNIGRGRVG